MGETPKPTPALIEAQSNVHDAEHVLTTTTPLLIDRLLISTGGNVELTEDLMKDVANLAGQAGALAVAKRREAAATYTTEHQELHPDNMSPRQESGLYGNDGAQPIISALDTIRERAKKVTASKRSIEYHLDPDLQSMVDEIRGSHNRFIHLDVQFSPKHRGAWEFRGDQADMLDSLLKGIEKGNVRVLGKSIGTYTEGSGPPHESK